MFRWGKEVKLSESSVCVFGEKIACMRAKYADKKLHIISEEHWAAENFLQLRSLIPSNISILLMPQDYTFGVVPMPPVEEPAQLREAIRWAYAKDAEINMEEAEFEFLAAEGMEEGGGLLRSSAWVFAIEKARLTSILSPLIKAKIKVTSVDVLALSQRNLMISEIMSDDVRPGAYASLVIGSSFSALGIVSHKGDLLFHKQLEWTEGTLVNGDSRERLVLDLQRNFGFFERRLSAVGVVSGVVFGRNAADIASFLEGALGSFDWTAPQFPYVDFEQTGFGEDVSGERAWFLGALWREYL